MTERDSSVWAPKRAACDLCGMSSVTEYHKFSAVHNYNLYVQQARSEGVEPISFAVWKEIADA